jgi:hypothetical protein
MPGFSWYWLYPGGPGARHESGDELRSIPSRDREGSVTKSRRSFRTLRKPLTALQSRDGYGAVAP